MLSELFGLTSRMFPNLKRAFWRAWYEYLADRYDEADWAFMNLGFANFDLHAQPLDLSLSDEKDLLCIQLYHHVAGAVGLQGLDVLDIGCGRGGGCSYIMRYLKPRSVVGLDISQKAIDLCNVHHAAAGLCFCQGDAEALPFVQSAFDVVINVESSHCYGSMKRFLSEASRVLRPNGCLLIADLRGRDLIGSLREDLRWSGLKLLKEEVITLNVLMALERDNERKQALIREKVPRLLRSAFQQFAGIKGTRLYESLRRGRAEYLNFVLRKKAGLQHRHLKNRGHRGLPAHH